MSEAKLGKIIDEVEAQNPYKVPGQRDTYSEYAEGWSDACDIIRSKIQDYLTAQGQNDEG